MNFFEHQDQARRQTRRMLALFVLAVVVIVVAVDAVVALAVGVGRNSDGGLPWKGLFELSVVVVSVIAAGSMYRTATLFGGGAAVARGLGAVEVPADSTNFSYRRLRNIVEEIAIASGVPVPDVFVLEQERGINAFAAGYAPTDAAITVSRGALDKLTRAELQGVVGHEFSHILNGDMRLNIRLMGVVFGILVIATIGRKIAEASARGRAREFSGAVFFGLALLAVGYVGVIFARLIKASISRQREYLADASAVQFTRQVDGIAGALKKIGALSEGSRLATSDAEEVAHMLFSDGVGYSALFATHPPLVERIQRLDRSFREEDFPKIAAAWAQPVRVDDSVAEGADVSIAGFAPAGSLHPAEHRSGRSVPPANAELRVSPPGVVSQVGHPDDDDRAVAGALRNGIPEGLRKAAWQPEQAIPLVLAVLISAEPAISARQFALIADRYDVGTRDLVADFAERVAILHPMRRLPLAALAFPVLRRRPRAELVSLMGVLRELIDVDGRVSLQEYCLSRLLAAQVFDSMNPVAVQTGGRLKLTQLRSEIHDLLAVLADHGHEDASDALRAYVAGLHEVLPNEPAAYRIPREWVAALDRALPRLDRLAPAGKQLVVAAMTRAIAADGRVSVAEAELLRTVCAALHCPLPPLLTAENENG